MTRTPPGFLFAVKLYQKFTHPDMYLARDGVSDWDLSRDDFDLFRAGIDPIAAAGRLAAVLIQFPESFHADDDARGYLDWLLEALAEYPLAVELRHKSWDAEGTVDLLGGYGATRVLADEPFKPLKKDVGSVFRDLPKNTPDVFFVRPPPRPQPRRRGGSTRRRRIATTTSTRPTSWSPSPRSRATPAASGRRVLMYMNNHFSAKSVANAVILKRKLGQPIRGDYPPALVDRYPELEGVVPTSGLPL